MKQVLILGLFASAFACATPEPAAPPAPAVEKPIIRTSAEDYRVPEQLGDFRLERLADLEPAQAGFMARYQAPNVLLDFFVYSARNLPREISVANALWWEYERAKSDVDAAAPQREWKIALASEEIVRADTFDGEIDGVLAVYRGETKDGVPLLSSAYVALLRSDFVKMRATWRGAASAEAEQAIAVARREFYAKLEPRAERSKLEFDGAITLTSLDPGAACAFISQAMITSILEQMLNDGFTLHTPERAVALLDAALASGELVDAKCTDPTLRDLATTREAGFLREYVWVTMRPSYWRDPGDLRLEEFDAFRRKNLKAPPATYDFGVNLQFREPGAASAPAEAP